MSRHDCNGSDPEMAVCESCGNNYDKAFEVVMAGERHVFDSFECAIHMLAPRCEHCECRIVGHGMESDGRMYCCKHCADKQGVDGLRDRVE
jgi:hypothetical protein